MTTQETVPQTTDQREAEKRARVVAQLRKAADLIEQHALPVPHGVTFHAPINLPDDESDALLSTVADRLGMPVDRSTPTQPSIKLDLGGGGVYHIYYSTAARSAAYNEASKAMVGWDKALLAVTE